jgi:hypothetical protein
MEPLISRLERARNIAAHFEAALGDLSEVKEAGAFAPRVTELYHKLHQQYMAMFRKAHPEFVEMEERAKKMQAEYEKVEEAAAKVREQTARNNAELEAKRKAQEMDENTNTQGST